MILVRFSSVPVSYTTRQKLLLALLLIIITSWVPVEGKSAVCVICDLIIIIISLSQILLSYIPNTSRTHAHARTYTHRRSGCRCSMGRCARPWRPFSPVPLAINDRSLLHSNNLSCARSGFPEVLGVFRV